jgi:hypothetical protein
MAVNVRSPRERVRHLNARIPSVAILGMGPSAAYAFRACQDSGIRAHVFGLPSTAPRGAFWLYQMPGNYKVDPDPIMITSTGSAEQYVYKQWGRRDIASSFPAKQIYKYGYNPATGLVYLWEGLDNKDVQVGPLDIPRILDIAAGYDVVLQTFATPGPVLAGPRGPVRFPIAWKHNPNSGANTVLYNGQMDAIVRSSWLWNIESHELTANTSVGPWEENGFAIDWRTDLHPDTRVGAYPPPAGNVKYLGRYATAQRKALSYEAYGATLDHIHSWRLNHGR